MLDPELSLLWAADGHLPQRALRWSWARAAGALGLRRGLRALALEGDVDPAASARGFFEWVRGLEPELYLQPYDPVDHAHYACGSLLRCLLRAHPADCRPAAQAPVDDPVLQAWRAWPEAALLTRLALTLLDAWRRSLGAAPLVVDPDVVTPQRIASYFENAREDAGVAVAFLDLFSGAEPVWEYPTLILERPAMQRALARGAGRPG